MWYRTAENLDEYANTFVQTGAFDALKNSNNSIENAPTLGDILSPGIIQLIDADPTVKVFYSKNHPHRGTFKTCTPEQAIAQNIPEKYIIIGENSDINTLIHEAVHTSRAKKGRAMLPDLAEPSAQKAENLIERIYNRKI